MTDTDTEYRSVAASRTSITELMVPAYANFGGKVHGGVLLSLMDKVAYACAVRHAGRYCVTASIDDVHFLQPVEVGELVTMNASVHHVGRTSMVIGIQVIAENFHTGLAKHTNTSYFRMVAKDDQGIPAPVPGLVLETEAEARGFLEAIRRIALAARFRDELDGARAGQDLDSVRSALASERCRLALTGTG